MAHFKTYSWSVGTTSFRVEEVTFRIEKQLQLLKKLWEENPSESWENNNAIQAKYFDMLAANGVAKPGAPIKSKDARQKTSSLKELGLIDEGRKLTKVGNEILSLLEDENITERENIFGIEKDAFIYLKQLLKLKSEAFDVRPFVATIFLINKLDYISFDEFTYLAPLCHNRDDTLKMAEKIKKIRDREVAIDEVVLEKLKSMDNYQEALRELLSGREEIVVRIPRSGFNRKSAQYDQPYADLFLAIKSLNSVGINSQSIKLINAAISKIIGKSKTRWKQKFFGNSLSNDTQKEHLNSYWQSSILRTSDQDTLLQNFFWEMHLIKWKVNLEEYADLNRRFFQLADVLIFKDDNIKLQLFAQHYFKECISDLLNDKTLHPDFTNNIKLEDISKSLEISPDKIYENLGKKVGRKLDPKSAYSYLNDERKKQLDRLIEEKFSKPQLIELLKKIEERDDGFVQEYVTSNANTPTIFEYVLGICWYHISDSRFDLLDSIKLSLDANMLPKTHASGGQGDIYIKYEKIDFADPHNLLLEATLTNSSQQRRTEMEPVSRHLGQMMVENEGVPSYCVFVSNHLDENVIYDFRGRKFTPYTHSGKTITGMKILPIDTSLLVHVLKNEITYEQLYLIFGNAFDSEVGYEDWFNIEIKETIESLPQGQ